MQAEFTEKQRQFIEWLACPRYERIPPTEEMFARQIDVDPATLWRWKKIEGFTDEVNKLARKSIGVKLPEVYGALLREAEKGEFQHIKLLLELAGEYVPAQKTMNEMSGALTVNFGWADTDIDDGEDS